MVVGLLALNAAVIGLAVLILRAASSPWVFATSPRGVAAARASWPGWCRRRSWRGPALTDVYAPLVPTLLAIAVRGRWRRGCCTSSAPALPRGSQALRLLVALLALVLPSVVLYPSLVDAAGRARRQLVTERYAPEVLNQRPDVRLKLSQALVEIDRIEGARCAGAGQRPAGVGPAADRCRVPGLVADQPGHAAADVERRAAQPGAAPWSAASR